MITLTPDEEANLTDTYSDFHRYGVSPRNMGKWSYSWFIENLDDEFHVSEHVFDAFMQEIKDGARCATCGQTTDTLIDDPEGTLCGHCGQNWRWI